MRNRPEWIGKTKDSPIPPRVKMRIIERQNNKCALTGRLFTPADTIEFDHKVDIWLHGEHRENNLRAVLKEAHARKTRAQAPIKAKVMRTCKKHLGINRRHKWPYAHLKKKLDGTVVNRETGETI